MLTPLGIEQLDRDAIMRIEPEPELMTRCVQALVDPVSEAHRLEHLARGSGRDRVGFRAVGEARC